MNIGTVCALIAALAPAADPAVIESAVQDWLDDHPEATTTVQDGSITEVKLASALAAKITGMETDVSGLKNDLNSKIDEPENEGTSGQVLTTDGNGGRNWTTVQGGGGSVTVDDEFSDISTNPVQNKVITEAINNLDDNAVQYVSTRTFNVGENLLTSETTFTGTGWSGSLANGFTHATGNTEPLVLQAETVEGQAYIIDFDYSGDIGGDNMFVTIGDMPKVDVYHGSIRPFVGVISDGGYLEISCKSTYTGTVSNIKIRPIIESGGTELTFECAEITNGQNPLEISSWHVVAIGRDVLSKNVNGTRTVAIGDRALEKIVTGHRNIAIGPYAMPFVTEGDCNVSIGADTLYNPAKSTGESKAYSNVAIGKGTMLNGNLVQNNIAIGHGSMGANDLDAEENVCVGRQAGYNTKNNNTFIGHRAGYYYTGTQGVDNVCVGHNAGFTPYVNGLNNVYIGADARANVAGASASSPKICNNSIAIGKGATVSGSFQIVIGNANYTTVKIAGKTLIFNQDGTVTWE